MSAKTFTLYNHVFFTRKMTDSTIFATRFYNNFLIDISSCIHYWTPQSWFMACCKPSRSRFTRFNDDCITRYTSAKNFITSELLVRLGHIIT